MIRMIAIIAPAMMPMMRAVFSAASEVMGSWPLRLGGLGVRGIITGGNGGSVLVMEVLLVPGLLPAVDDGLLLTLSAVL
jgi:hypothetical protein